MPRMAVSMAKSSVTLPEEDHRDSEPATTASNGAMSGSNSTELNNQQSQQQERASRRRHPRRRMRKPSCCSSESPSDEKPAASEKGRPAVLVPGSPVSTSDKKESLAQMPTTTIAAPAVGSPVISPSASPLSPAGGPLLVLKLGTSTIMETSPPSLCLSNLGKFVDTVCHIREAGYQVVIVSSGAVGAGCIHLKIKSRPETLQGKQAASAVGQCRLMRIYDDLFAVREEKVAQLIVTRSDLMDRNRFINFKNTLKELLRLGVVPIINENDSLATVQLRFGDNDTLAAYVAVSLTAQWLFLLTDVDCLYTKNPRLHSDALPIPFVEHLENVYEILDDAENLGTSWGSGGMRTKVVAAKMATATGTHTCLCNGKNPERVLDVMRFVEKSSNGDDWGKILMDWKTEKNKNSKIPTSASANQIAVGGAASSGSSSAKSSPEFCQGEGGSGVPSTLSGGGHLLQHHHSHHHHHHHHGHRSSNTSQHQLQEQEKQKQQATRPTLLDVPLCSSERRSKSLSEFTKEANLSRKVFDYSSAVVAETEGSNAVEQTSGFISVPSLSDMPYVGTIFAAQECTQKIRDQRRWILSLPVKGVIYVDFGAATAIIGGKKSLFAAGIVGVKGVFFEGEAASICWLKQQQPQPREETEGISDNSSVEEIVSTSSSSSSSTVLWARSCRGGGGGMSSGVIQSSDTSVPPLVFSVDDDEAEIARCLVNFSSAELEKIKGLKSSQFQKVLGYECEAEVAHRENIIFTNPCLVYGCGNGNKGACNHVEVLKEKRRRKKKE